MLLQSKLHPTTGPTIKPVNCVLTWKNFGAK